MGKIKERAIVPGNEKEEHKVLKVKYEFPDETMSVHQPHCFFKGQAGNQTSINPFHVFLGACESWRRRQMRKGLDKRKPAFPFATVLNMANCVNNCSAELLLHFRNAESNVK